MGLQESLQPLVAAYLLQLLSSFDKHAVIVRMNDSRALSSGYEAFETWQARTSFQVRVL